MTLQEYLSSTDKKPSAFAAEIGVPASTITRILNGERTPGLELMELIHQKTAGQVQPNDFMRGDRPATPERAA